MSDRMRWAMSSTSSRDGDTVVTLDRVEVNDRRGTPLVVIEGHHEDGDVFRANMLMHNDGSWMALGYFCKAIDYRPESIEDLSRDGDSLGGRKFLVRQRRVEVDGSIKNRRTYHPAPGQPEAKPAPPPEPDQPRRRILIAAQDFT